MEQTHFSTFKTLFRFKKSLLPLAMAPIILTGCGGSDGKDGLNGIDATTEPKVVQGVDGLNGINGQDGAIGLNGTDGQDGVNGLNGTDGQDGVNGLNGTDGQDGVNGMNGTDGQDGVNGINGTDGQDGVDGISPTPWPTPTPDPTPTPYPVTTNSIDLSGGRGASAANGVGGNGGSFEFEKYSLTGDIVLSDEIRTERSYTPQSFTLNFGDNPLTITEDTSIQCDAFEPPAGEYYCYSGNEGNGGIFLSDGDERYAEFEERVTGLSIAEGATLTLLSGESPSTYTAFFANDINLEGSIAISGIYSNLRLYSASFSASSTGAIDITPSNSEIDGGTLSIYTNYVLINAASLSANGSEAIAEDSSGGEGGTVSLSAETYLENSGSLSASGANGVGSSSSGGEGGDVSLSSDRFIFNSGDIAVNGGTGGHEGGSGGEIELHIDDSFGKIFNDGNLYLNGGNGQAGTGAGTGGDGGELYLSLYTQNLYLGGSVSMIGGDGGGSDVGEGVGGNGGNGGSIEIFADNHVESNESIDIVLAAEINLSGGTGLDLPSALGNGGNGGNIYIQDEYEALEVNIIVEATDIKLTGGEGGFAGHGGNVNAFIYEFEGNRDTTALSDSASIEIGLNIDVSGGNGASIEGHNYAGNGGEIDVGTREKADRLERLSLIVSGNLSANGGQSFGEYLDFYGFGGQIFLYGYDNLTVDGDLQSNGGDNSGDGNGGHANQINLSSDKGPVVVNGDISLNGGNGGGFGGSAGGLRMYGRSVSVSGVISVNGGNADPLAEGSTGGNSGSVEAFIYDADYLPATLGSSISAEPGEGETAGHEGSIFDGLICTGDCDFGAQ